LENTMNALRKDTLLMTALLSSAVSVLVLGASVHLFEPGRALEAAGRPQQTQAAVRPTTQEVPAVVVRAAPPMRAGPAA
jgi:hypothetical protein